jgi:NAD(P)-dependent dehydrogenase (short-subunit alcohol dehydrogenase family)
MSNTKTISGEKVWLITGCSTGFGKEIALAALKRGDKVIATARSADKLGALVEAGAHALQLDVTSPLAELEALANKAIGVYGRVDVLVNNAAYVLQGAVEAASPDETLAQFNTNVFGVLNVTRAFLPHLRARRSGVIALISSLAGWVSYPGTGYYCATKFAIEGLGEALHAELAPLGISVTIIEPGYFRTSLLSQGTNTMVAQRHIGDYDQTAGAVIAQLKAADGKQPGDPAKAAQRIVDVLTLSGSAAGRKEVPVRLALGQDAYEAIKSKCESSLALLEEWKDLSRGTEHDDVITQSQ